MKWVERNFPILLLVLPIGGVAVVGYLIMDKLFKTAYGLSSEEQMFVVSSLGGLLILLAVLVLIGAFIIVIKFKTLKFDDR